MEKTYHAEVKEYLEAAFNDDSVSGGCYKLNLTFWGGDVYTDVYYKKLIPGQFDLGYGSISGNTYDILDYMLILSADQSLSNGFTLNYGPRTDEPDQYFLIYNGVKWSFDALISAANQPTLVKDGKLSSSFEITSNETYTTNADGTITVSATVSTFDGISVALDDVYAFGNAGGTGDYAEETVLSDDKANLVVTTNADGSKTFTVTISAALLTKYTVTNYYEEGKIGIDFYLAFSGEVDGIDMGSDTVKTIYFAPAQ